MNQAIVSAIQSKSLVSFRYDNVLRIVEPHTYGLNKKRHEVLSAWQVSGKSIDTPDWRLYVLARMTDLQVLPRSFEQARPGYERGDSRMTTIYAQL